MVGAYQATDILECRLEQHLLRLLPIRALHHLHDLHHQIRAGLLRPHTLAELVADLILAQVIGDGGPESLAAAEILVEGLDAYILRRDPVGVCHGPRHRPRLILHSVEFVCTGGSSKVG